MLTLTEVVQRYELHFGLAVRITLQEPSRVYFQLITTTGEPVADYKATKVHGKWTVVGRVVHIIPE